MKMQNLKLLSLLLIFSLLQSCAKDWLDEKPSNDVVVPSNLKDLQGLLDNSERMNMYSPGLAEIGSDGHYITDDRFRRNSNNEKNAYLWNRLESFLKSADWLVGANYGTYNRIFYCNIILETLEHISPASSIEQETYNNIKGQALFQRARTFYEMLQIYAPPYNPATAKNDLGIPLRLESDINIPAERVPVEDCYNRIIDNLIAAVDLLPQIPLYKTRASKPAAYGLLARIYLSMENYQKAGENADKCLQLYNELIDYNTLVPTASNPIILNNAEVIFHSSMTSYISYGSNLLIDSTLYALYIDGDLRKRVFFGKNANGITFKGSYNGNFNGLRNFNGLATDEMFLIRGECYARSGKTAEAMDDLNHLLATRWDSGVVFIPYTAIDAEVALKQILQERRKELLVRGIRWSDLRRLNHDPRFAVTISRTVAGEIHTLEPNSYKYTYPIPDDIIEMTGMPQNPGWE